MPFHFTRKVPTEIIFTPLQVGRCRKAKTRHAILIYHGKLYLLVYEDVGSNYYLTNFYFTKALLKY